MPTHGPLFQQPATDPTGHNRQISRNAALGRLPEVSPRRPRVMAQVHAHAIHFQRKFRRSRQFARALAIGPTHAHKTARAQLRTGGPATRHPGHFIEKRGNDIMIYH